ncbi:peptidylprolyl isomerase [Aquisalimonas asiatica]|uniref:Peptidyl-prolyl cis-trans isomerase n=1 Tax=Aquisalimonas asiatica TaxID=406100 RepID=A0A1H8RUN5_9GAMM|nr:peptidylprolyl isomerase [Aquisalimonas asiatica]SEO69884.1 peptidyl-prolyl cis-trans isomerase A (cyclophilin A) [Aquisalimonas asiatica]
MQTVRTCVRRAMVMAAALIMGMATAAAVADESEREGEQDMVIFKTNYGDITLELYPEDAPVTVENFLQYVDDGFYDGTIFHRVIPGFVIQGGGLDEDMQRLETRAPIENEADNGLKNERGMLSMARTQDVNSATSQFFINLADNAFLDHGVRDFGYAVFARVVDGMDVVDRIAEVPTGRQAGQADVPSETIKVEEARRK